MRADTPRGALKVSSGLPEVANYPFTTREMLLGHIHDKAYGM